MTDLKNWTKMFVFTFAIVLYSCVHSNKPVGSAQDGKAVRLVEKTPKEKINNKLTGLDSIEYQNSKIILESGDNVNKAIISKDDSSITITWSKYCDHRIIGFAEPNTKSERLLLLSIFTDDVHNNPFGYKLGSFYQTSDMDNLNLKFIGIDGDFIKALAIDSLKKTTALYFERKWMEFE